MRAERAFQEEYDRFQQDQPQQLTDTERAQIVALASDIPKLWHATETAAAERKEVVRLLVERVVVHVQANNERVEVEITWCGGLSTKHTITRSVGRYKSLVTYPQLLKRIRQLRRAGMTIARIAKRLNEEGFRTPRSRKGYTSTSVRKLLSRCRQRAKRVQGIRRSNGMTRIATPLRYGTEMGVDCQPCSRETGTNGL